MSTASEKPRISCRLEMLPGERVADQLHAAQEFGFDGVSLPGRLLERWLAPLRECVRDSPLPLVAISLGFRKSLLSPDAADRRTCRDDLLKLFDLCAEFGVGRFNLPPCLAQDNPVRVCDLGASGSMTGRLDRRLLTQLPKLGDAARQRGVHLLIEPVNRYESDYLNSIEHAAALCRKLGHPAVGFTADFFHMQLEEPDTGAAVRTAGATDEHRVSPLRHVHVADNTRVEPGAGSLNFQPGFRALKDIGYRGWIEIECRTLSGPATEVLPRSVEYLSKAWSDA